MGFDEWEKAQGWPSGFEVIGRARMSQVWEAAKQEEREACTALAEDTASGKDADAIAEAIRMRSNAKVRG